MWTRIPVAHACEPRCPSCIACREDSRVPPLDEVLPRARGTNVILGGGDASAWPHLAALLEALGDPSERPRIWIEAPARHLASVALERLHAIGVHGVVVQIEATGAAIRTLDVGDGEEVIDAAERLGLETMARVCVRPKTFPIVVPLAQRLAPRTIWLELVRQDWGAPEVPIWREAVRRTLQAAPNVVFSGHRMRDRGYLPPCAVPEVWAERPDVWRGVLADRDSVNDVLPQCAECALRARCQWKDVGAIDPSEPIVAGVAAAAEPSQAQRADARAAPAKATKATHERVVCTRPWTTMEIVDPAGDVHQCCSDWTVGARANLSAGSLRDLWNSDGYRAARRMMKEARGEGLCRSICPRLYDGALGEEHFFIADGSKAFVDNQLLALEDIEQGREVAQALPLHLAICPSTYCNYDCVMCLYGRTPRRDLSESIWDQVLDLAPTLRSLTLLGGEPFADAAAMRFLRELDARRFPDCLVDVVTNGSLLTDKALAPLSHCNFGSITVSLNAGTAECYERVQRGDSFERVLANLDHLLALRATRPSPFAVTLSFVVMPMNAATLIPFGEIARARSLPIRLMPLNVDAVPELDFYGDAAEVDRVLDELRAFASWAREHRPGWVAEIEATGEAIRSEAAGRGAAARPGGRRLPLVR